MLAVKNSMRWLDLTENHRRRAKSSAMGQAGDFFNDVGFLSHVDGEGWRVRVREAFPDDFELVGKVSRVGTRVLFDIPTEEVSHERFVAPQ